MADVPQQIKNDNWWFGVLARSDDPAVKCLNLINLVTSLKTTMQIAGNSDHDKVLQRATLGANRAWYEYSGLHNPGLASQTAHTVLGEVLFLVYDLRYSSPRTDSFKGREK